jgi:hypothetical protein
VDEFADRDLSVFTSARVREGAAVLTVFHERDGDWQFLSNHEESGSEALFVHVGHLTDHDSTLREIADLPLGWKAWRAGLGAEWERHRSLTTKSTCRSSRSGRALDAEGAVNKTAVCVPLWRH